MPSIKLTIVMIIICSVIYPLLIAGIGRMAPGKGAGEKLMAKGRVVGYEKVGQKFTQDKYFWGRPSAVDYNAAGSGGSNKGPSNPDYLRQVSDRIDSFMIHNPEIKRRDIPAEMITASGSGLDPDISKASAMVQVKRIAEVRKISEDKLVRLVEAHEEKSLAGILGPSKVNVLKLNIVLDQIDH